MLFFYFILGNLGKFSCALVFHAFFAVKRAGQSETI